jgi:hypothetical protein
MHDRTYTNHCTSDHVRSYRYEYVSDTFLYSLSDETLVASKKKSQEPEQHDEQPQWMHIIEEFVSTVTGVLSGSVATRANEMVHDAEERLTRLAVLAVLGVTGFIYVSIALIHILRLHFSLAIEWGYLIIGLVLIVAALAYSKR